MVTFLWRFIAGMLGLVLLLGSLVGGYWLGADWDFASRAVASPNGQLPTNLPGDSQTESATDEPSSPPVESATPTPTPTPTPKPKVTKPAAPKPAKPAKVVYLTFDDGPDPDSTPQVLAILKRYGVHGTFFQQGAMVEAYPDVAKQVAAEGHRIGNHSWDHPSFTKLSYNYLVTGQLEPTNDKIRATTGQTPTCVRPPYGAVNDRVRGAIADEGMTVAMWDVDPRDWARPGTSTIVSRVLDRVYPGAVVLLHDAGGNRTQTLEALPQIIESLQSQGYAFGTMCRAS
jgi:peptidoglycan/xylan/chitin deacetylase (PgdA/CDA1 family)